MTNDHAPLFLRQFLNPSKVEEYLQLVEKTQGVDFRFCNLVVADREEVALPVGVARDCRLTLVKSRLALGSPGCSVGCDHAENG